MIHKNRFTRCHGQHRRGSLHAPDSFGMVDAKQLFYKMMLSDGHVIADLGCGAGRYSLYAAQIVGDQGFVYAIDQHPDYVRSLNEEARRNCYPHLHALAADITEELPISDGVCDYCFMSNVLHSIPGDRFVDLFRQVSRVLKPDGRLCIVECNKTFTHHGPQQHLRIDAEELDAIVGPYGFLRTGHTDLGKNYLNEYQQA